MRFQCLSLLIWLEEWYETVYKRHPGFQKGSKPLLALDNLFPVDLPDTLYGEKWAFVQLPFSGWYFNSRWQHRRSHLCNNSMVSNNIRLNVCLSGPLFLVFCFCFQPIYL
ncbi:hypothetical protein Hanom_Chr07g00644631 [Helianthus anomalus]